MSAALAAGALLTLGGVAAKEASRQKTAKSERKRDKAIDRENRRGAIARALGAPVGSSFTPPGTADTSKLDMLGGLASVGGNLLINQGMSGGSKSDPNVIKAEPRPVADNLAIRRQLAPKQVQGSFPITGTNIG